MAGWGKYFLLIAVVAFATFYGADAVKCYYTSDLQVMDNCVWCRKDSAYSSVANVATRSCVPTCVQTVQSGAVGTGAGTYCCQTDYCNGSNTINQVNLVLGALASIVAFYFHRQ